MRLKNIFTLRYISLIAVVSLFVGSALMFIVGAIRTGLAVVSLFLYDSAQHLPEHISTDTLATVRVVNAVDSFLFALVLLIFGFGIYTLFIHTLTDEETRHFPSWMVVKSVGELKTTLIQVIIVILCVNVLETVLITGPATLTWTMLVIPLSVVSLAAAMKLMQH